MKITFCGQKGGTGKTTLSFLVAETLSRAGKKVAVRDDDPQGSITQIITDLQEANKTNVDILENDRAGEYEFIIVDTLPRLSSRSLTEAVKESDYLVLPLKASIIDIRATLPAVEMIKDNIKPDAKAFGLWNMVRQGTKISKELKDLESVLEFPVLKQSIPERIGFTYATLQGYDVLSMDDKHLLQQIILECLV